MEKDAEAADLDHVPEGQPGIARLEQGSRDCSQRADQRDRSQRLLVPALVDERLDHHDDNAKEGQHEFGKNADVIRDFGNSRHRLRAHCPATLAANGRKLTSAFSTAGSIEFSQIMGATPMTSARTAAGHSAAFSSPRRSGMDSLACFVTFPKNTRWYIHSK